METSLNLGAKPELLFSGAWSKAVTLELSNMLVEASAETWLTSVSFSFWKKEETGFSWLYSFPKKKDLTSVVSKATFICGNLSVGIVSKPGRSFLMVFDWGLILSYRVDFPSLRTFKLFSLSRSFLNLSLVISFSATSFYYCESGWEDIWVSILSRKSISYMLTTFSKLCLLFLMVVRSLMGLAATVNGVTGFDLCFLWERLVLWVRLSVWIILSKFIFKFNFIDMRISDSL